MNDPTILVQAAARWPTLIPTVVTFHPGAPVRIEQAA